MTRRSRSPIACAVLAAATVAAGLAVTAPAPPAGAAVTASTQWVPAPDPSSTFRTTTNDKPFVSADGRWVAFQSADPTTGTTDVFLTDRATATTVPVAGGAQGSLPAVSADGCFVAFVSTANLDPADQNKGPDVYRWSRDGCPDAGRSIVVTKQRGIAFGVADNIRPSISDDGSRVAFTLGNDQASAAGYAQAQGASPTTSFADAVFLSPDSRSGQAAISGDGRFVVLVSRLSPVDGSVTSYPRAYRWAVDGGLDPSAFVLLSDAGLAAVSPAIDRDGSFVAFSSIPFATEFVQWQVQAVDLTSGVPSPPILVSQRNGQGGTGNSGNNGFQFEAYPEAPGVAVSGDGLSVAFTTLATDLLGEPAGAPTNDVLVWFLVNGTLQPLSTGASGQPVTTSSYSVSLSFTARAATFDGYSYAQLVGSPPPGMDPQLAQAYIRDRPPELTLTPNLDFGVVTVGSSTDTRSVEVRNTGFTPLVVSTVAGSVGNVVVDGSACAGKFLSPNETCQVTVRVQVTAGGLLDATVVASAAGPFVDAFGVTGQSSVRVTGVVPTTTTTPTTTRPPATTVPPTTTTRPPTTTAAPRPVLSLNPPVADFGSLALGTPSTPAAFVLRNAGTTAALISEASLTGSGATEFTLVTSCRGVTLAPGASCSSNVIATPTVVGSQTATLVFTSAGVTATAALAVTGADTPSLVASPAVGSANSVTTIIGRNFPAGATVTLQWGDGRPVGTVVAGPDGAFALPLVILPNRLGTDAVIAIDPVPIGANPAIAPFLVVQGTATPPAAGPLRTLFRG